MNSGQVVDRNDADQHSRQFNQVPLFALLGRELGLASAKVAAAVRDLLDALARANGEVAHLNPRVALVVLVCPLGVERGGNTRSRPDKSNCFLCEAKRVTQTDDKNQREQHETPRSAAMSLCAHWHRKF